MNILGSSAGLSNMSVALTFAAAAMIIEQSALSYITQGRRERLSALMASSAGDKKNDDKTDFAIDESTIAMLQGVRAYALVSLFGILFMSVSTPLIAGSRLMTTKEFSYLLVGMTLIADIMAYNMFSIKHGMTKGERDTRQGMLLILFIFQAAAGYQVFQSPNIMGSSS